MTTTDDHTSPQELFEDVVALIRDTPVTPELQISDADKLSMYGLYKQATLGPCDDTTAAPSRFQLVARAKYQAWLDCQSMTKRQAMLEYVQLASSHDHWLGSKCREKLLEWKESVEPPAEGGMASADESVSGDSSLLAAGDDERRSSSENKTSSLESGPEPMYAQSTTRFYSWLDKHFGIRPLIPRGQLDISYRDLTFAIWHCIRCSSSMSRYCQLEQQIARLWNSSSNTTTENNNNAVITGLSVRSLLDLYLRAASFPPESEIIVSPPINIPAMMQVLQHHNLNVIPVDVPQDGVVSINVDAIQHAITDKTVAIMIVHPFGMISTTNDDMKSLRSLVDKHELHLLEDVAECFTGLGEKCYKGSDAADVSFFSFGTIKTATALGGGVAILHNTQQANKMNRMHHSLYKQQTAAQYLRKVLWCILVRFLADCPLLYGILFALFSWIGLNFDAIVSSSTRSFSTATRGVERRSSDASYMEQLRKRPSTALLSVLAQRLQQSQTSVSSVKSRIERCKYMRDMLEKRAPSVTLPVALYDSANSFWLFPIQVNEPDAVSRKLCEHGFDVPRGLSQLECIAKSCLNQKSCKSCHRTEEMMNRILYLPVASRNMSKQDMRRMAVALNSATATETEVSDIDVEGADICGVCRSLGAKNRCRRLNSFAFVLLLVVAIDAVFSCRLPLSGFILFTAKVALKLFMMIMTVATLAAITMRWAMAEFYLRSSQCFAEHSSMLFKRPSADSDSDDSSASRIPEAGKGIEPLLNMDALRIPSPSTASVGSAGSIEDGVVLLTGATGFIGRLLLRDLLLHRRSLSIPGGVVVLCRPKRGKSAQRRVSKLLDDPMYSFLSTTEKQELVHVVEGDVTKSNVGLSPEDVDRVCNVLNVSHVIHCAASVSFTQTLKEAAVSNIASSLNLQLLAGRLKLKSARYVHISTAFVHGGMTGTESDPLPEQLHTLEGYDAADLFRSMLGTEYRASVAMKELRFPNTYTFSKCICEHLLARDKNVPTVIVRPSIVGPAVQEPYEGWAGDKPTTIVAAACLYMSYQWNLWCFGNHRVPYIPVDVASGFILAKAFASGKGEGTTKVCVSPTVSSSSDDGFERVSQFSESSLSEVDDTATSTSSADNGRVEREHFIIHNLAWDWKSPDSAMFTWVDYAVAVTHLGAFFGYFSRLTAYIGLFATVRVLPGMKVSEGRFRMLHRILVQFPIDTVVNLFKLIGRCPRPIQMLSMLSPFLDLPLLFFQFMNNDFYFSSELVAPGELDGEKYLFSCAMAAEHFVAAIKACREKKESTREPGTTFTEPGTSVVSVAGALHKPTSSDLWWALTQPRGGFFVRFGGWVFRKILRVSSVDVTIDAQSLSLTGLARSSTNNVTPPIIVLAPNHRSFFDFLLISYICFALPELQIEIPFIAAADDFERLPLIGWLATRAHAFFLRRGKGKADPSLRATLGALKEECGDQGLCVEVFLEGSRSRDRRYLRPKTGLLRCLAETGDLLVVPISINYEEIPEQPTLANEIECGYRAKLNSQGLFAWLKKAFLGKVNIGRIHVAAAIPLHVDSSGENDFGALVTKIQRRQQDLVHVSNYHIRSASAVLDLSTNTVEHALTAIGCSFWPDSRGDDQNCITCRACPLQHASVSEQWMVMLQFGHKLSPFFETTRPRWCKWLNEIGGGDVASGTHDLGPSVQKLVEALGKSFDAADKCADVALTRLRVNGFDMPTGEHVIQSILKEQVSCPTLLLRAAVAFKLESDKLLYSVSSSCNDTPLLTVNSPDQDMSCGDETLGFWGFSDSGFALQMDQNGEASVTMNGDRYSICGKLLNKLIPFIENETNTRIDLLKESPFPPPMLSPLPNDLTEENINLLESSFSKVSTSSCDRIRHGSGHSQEDVFLIRSGAIDNIRLPDAVVWPSSEDEVKQLVAMAKSNEWCLIPFGGGTNVSHATRCPTRETEPRPVLSVDMRHMDRVLWVNEEDGLAHVQSGITGRALVEEMGRRGYTIGHEPDSIEFSTLGGWIATKASGMKRNRYGNIEDIVKSVRVAGSEGLLWRGKRNDDAGPFGRESRGVDLLSMTLGSEGTFGIITSAVLRIWPLPECQEHDSVILPDFEHGLRFARDAARLGPNLPSSVRLLDNEHFRLGQALQGESSLVQSSLTRLWKMAHPVARSCSPDSVVCATILFEGTREEVQAQRRAIKTLASQHGGTCVGARVGKSGYELTFAIAYLRDFALTYNFLAESFETFSPWSKVERIIQATKKRIHQEHARRCLPGEAFVGSRVTQLYHEGACLYFYFCMNIRGVQNPSSVFAEIEHAAREEILENGGSLSHHHGIGKLRSEFTKEMDSDEYHHLLYSLKKSVDPSNTFGVRNGALAT